MPFSVCLARTVRIYWGRHWMEPLREEKKPVQWWAERPSKPRKPRKLRKPQQIVEHILFNHNFRQTWFFFFRMLLPSLRVSTIFHLKHVLTLLGVLCESIKSNLTVFLFFSSEKKSSKDLFWTILICLRYAV